MIRKFAPLSLLMLTCLLAACGGGKDVDTRLPEIGDNATILAFGDSITFGTGAKQTESYPSQLATLLGRKVVNAGVPGETTAGGLKRLPGVVNYNEPDLVILCLGGNDFLKRIDNSVTRQNLALMLSWLKEKGIPVVMMAVPKFGIGVTGSLSPHEMYAELSADYAVPLQNDVISDVLSERELKADSIHPNGKGYTQVAKALLELLKDKGAILP